jgi:hypothetical protein
MDVTSLCFRSTSNLSSEKRGILYRLVKEPDSRGVGVKKILKKRISYSCIGIVLLLTLMFLPGLPWAARFRHIVRKIHTKAEIKAAAWKGESPQLVSLSGKLATRQSNKQILEGAEIEALDSVSGWATLTNKAGEFVLRDVIWYPKANYTLIITFNFHETKQLRVIAPEKYPDDQMIALGELQLDNACQIDVTDTPGMNATSYLKLDQENLDYYKNLFAQLTQGKNTDEEKIEAINKYVASKFVLDRTTVPYTVPKQILESGSNSPWQIAVSLATLAEIGNYKTRMLDLIDKASPPATHMVTEIYYKDRWHLYDPILGISFRNGLGTVASYKDLKLLTEFSSTERTVDKSSPILSEQFIPFVNLYNSGFHHYYYLRRE